MQCSRLSLASSLLSAVLGTGAVDAAAAATPAAITPRILTQEGLAIALASNVLQSQLEVLALTLSPGKCHVLKGGGSARTVSAKKVSSTLTQSQVTVYFDLACKTPYIEAAADVTSAASGFVFTIAETATYLGLHGQALGSLSLNETATAGTKDVVLIGLGKFHPANKAPSVDLGLTCSLPTSPKATSASCAGGIAQTFPTLNLSLASVTPLTLTSKSISSPSNVSFSGSASDMRTGPAGSLSITTPTPSSLGIGGGGTAYGSAVTKGFASGFVLFPPTPTDWTITDAAHDARFRLRVVSNTTRDSKATVTRISSGAALANIAVDQSGTGTISYADGSRDAVTSWLLAD